MPRYPAMEAGELALARLSGAARARGFPAMRTGRTAAELTGGNWQRRPQGWGVDSPAKSSPARRRQLEHVDVVDAPVAEKPSTGFTLGSGGITDYANNLVMTAITAPVAVPWGSRHVDPAPESNSTDAAPVEVDPFEAMGGMFVPDDSPPPPPPPEPPEPTSSSAPPAAATPASSTGSVITIGALLAFLFS